MVLLNLLAALALLLWGALQMRRALRDLSSSWMDLLGRLAARGRYAAWAAGLASGVLQPQEAPVRRGAQLARLARLPAAGAHAAMLGGSLGSAFAVLAFSIAPAWSFHLLLIAGAVAWNANRPQRVRAAGRALFGAGVVLLGLQILAIAAAPAGDADLLAAVAQGLEQEALLACVFGVLAALLMRSLFAALLLLAAAGASWLPAGTALALLAGIHLGGALIHRPREPGGVAERRLAAGHLVAMLLAASALLLLAPEASRLMTGFDGVDLALANAAFCGLASAALLNLAGPLARMTQRWMPQRIAPTRTTALQHLESADPAEPSLALSAAVRQVMRLADLVGEMLQRATVAVLENDRGAIDAVGRAEQQVDDLYRATKRYLARIPQARLSAHEQRRWDELMVFLIALEQIADGVDSMLPRTEAWNAQRKLAYPPAAQAEFRALHALLSRNLQLAAGLCLERWPASADSLLAAEEQFRKGERSACAAHIARVVAGDAASIAVSGLHLDLLADLAQMNARLCGFARFFLELREGDEPEPAAPDAAAHSGKEARGIALASPATQRCGLD